MAVTLIDLTAELPPYAWETVTGSSDLVGERALEKARNWIKAKIAGCTGAVYDEENITVKEILLKRALYELYQYNDQEGIANDKKNDAYELLRAVYGACVDPTNQPSAEGNSGGTGRTSGGKVITRDRNRETF